MRNSLNNFMWSFLSLIFSLYGKFHKNKMYFSIMQHISTIHLWLQSDSGRTLEMALCWRLSTSKAASLWLCIFNIHQATLMKFGGPASLTLWIINWRNRFVLVLGCLVKSHPIQSHVCPFIHTIPHSHLDKGSDRYWAANSSPHLWFMLVPMSEHIKSSSVCACVCTCDRLC